MALSLLCGGLGVASAADGTVNVDESTPGTAVVYTTEGTQLYVEGKLGDYYTKDKVDEKLVDLKGDVTTNKNNIGDLQTKTANLDGTELTGMTTVETGALKVTGQISNGTVNTALADINDSMTQTKTNKEDIANLKTTTGDQDTAIKDLQKKTTNISYADGAGTSIDGITVKDGNIVGNGNSAITGLANVETNTIKTGSINGKSLTGTTVATATDVAAETLARKEADNKLEEKINEEKTARKGKDNELEGKITKNTQDIAKLDENGVKYDTAVKDTITLKGPDSTKITNLKDADLSDSSTDAVTGKQLNKTNEDLKTEAQTRKDMDTSLSNRADALEKNTGGITRNDAESKTIIEKSVTVDSKGNVTADGKLKGEGVDAGAGAITTTGAVNAGSLNVTNGATSLKETTVNGALTAKENATFEKNVTVEKDLTVNGKLNVDKISMKNNELKNGKKHDSATTITADEISNLAKVTEQGNITESQFTHNEKGTFNYAKDEKSTGEWKRATSNVTADAVSNKMTDSDGNTHTYYQTATESKEQLVNGDKSKSNFEKKTAKGNTISITEKDADGNLKSSLTNTQTVNGEKTSVTNEDSSSTINQGADQIRNNVTSKDGTKSSSTEVKADGITNTSVGTITNDAKDIVNKAQDTITNTAGTKITDTAGDSTVTTENGKGTTFTKTGSTAYREGGPTDTNISGNTITTGRVDANELGVSDKDGANTADLSVKAGEGVKASAGDGNTKGSLDVKADKVVSSVKDADGKGSTFKQRIDAIMGNVKTADGESEMKQKGDEITSVVGKGEATNSHVTQKKGSIEAAVTDGTSTNVSYDEASVSTKKMTDSDKNTHTYSQTATESKEQLVNGDKSKSNFEKKTAKGNTISITEKDADGNLKSSLTNTQTVNGEKTSVTNEDSSSTINQGADQIRNNVTSKDGTKSSSTEVKADGITNTSVGTITNDAKDIVNKAQDTITNTAGTKITDTAGDSTVTTENGKGTTFTKTGSTAYREGGPTDTNISGNTITTGKVTMDYADVMKDLGVKGNTTLGEAGKDTTLTVNSKATFNNGLTVTNGETKLKNTTIEGTLNVSENATFQKDVTANSFSVNGKTYIDSDGLNANNQVIRNVADGSISEGSKDAVNGGQLYNVKNDLEGKVNKVGANAAAMANLHPMEFDPDSKWNIAAAIGNYGSETAAALGAFYRPNDDVMVNLSTAFGTGENMVGGGVSVRLGKGGNKLSREESNALKDQVNDLTARLDALLSVLNPNMSKDFPDVPENHWAYEAVSRLAGNDIVQGYPDGEFHGERTMTRYEMAEIIYNALSRGAEAEKELVEEFKPELQAMAASEKATAERAEG